MMLFYPKSTPARPVHMCDVQGTRRAAVFHRGTASPSGWAPKGHVRSRVPRKQLVLRERAQLLSLGTH